MEATLLLNASFEPLKIVDWHRAMILVVQDKAEIIESHDRTSRTPRFEFHLPSVIRLRHYVKNKARQLVPFTRMNLYIRDNFTCQFCSDVFHPRDLTFDHVVPVSKGGSGGWENIVCACRGCNSKKADRTPEEAGMTLRRRPRRPPALPALKISVHTKSAPPAWRDFLFLNTDYASPESES